MQVIDPKGLPTEAQKQTEYDKKNELLHLFQSSGCYEFVMGIIDDALRHSTVIELLKSKGGDASEQEVGRLTMTEFMANKKIEELIKNKLKIR